MILTIAIPTYNRAHELSELLTNIRNELEQHSDLASHIEILISDNASTDDTGLLVSNFNIDYPCMISYVKNATNLGYDRNVMLAGKNASGRYVLFMSDDDLFEYGAIEKIFAIARNGSAELMLASERFYEMDGSVTNRISDAAYDGLTGDRVYENGIDILKMTNKVFVAISGFMVRKDLWDSLDFSSVEESWFIQTYAMLQLFPTYRVYVFTTPLISYRLNIKKNTNIKSSQEILKVAFGLLFVIKSSKALYPQEIYSRLYAKELKWARRLMVGCKGRDGIGDKKTVWKNMKYSYDIGFKGFVFDILLLWIPDFIFKIPYALYRFIKYKTLNTTKVVG